MRICQELDVVVDDFMGVRWSVDPTPTCGWTLTQKVREAGRIVKAWWWTPVNGEGREIIGMDVGTSEDGAFWLAFLRSLLPGASAGWKVVSDAHQGLRGAIADLGGAHGAAPTS